MTDKMICTLINTSNTTNCIPIYNKHEVTIIKNGSFYNIRTKDNFFINANTVGYSVMEKCNGLKTIYEIVKDITSEYDVTFNKAEKDILAFLHNMWRDGIISWKGINPYCILYSSYLNADLEFKRCFAEEAIQLIDNIYKESIFHSLINPKPRYKYENMNKLERRGIEYYFAIKKGKKTTCFIAISPNYFFQNNRNIVISFDLNYFYIDDISQNMFDYFVKWVYDNLYEIEGMDIEGKISSLQIEVNKNTDKEILLKTGFIYASANRKKEAEHYIKV